MSTRKPKSAQPLTRSTGTFGDSAEGGWWAVRWSIKRREIEAERQGRRLASWDQAILDAIRAFASGERSEAEVDRVIKIEDARKKSWCKSRARGGRRR